MRRVWALLVTASLITAWGCDKSYNERLNLTLDAMKYKKRLDDKLLPPPNGGKFQELLIFIRPPKDELAAKEFLLPLPEPAKFDLAASFLETQKGADAQPTGDPGAGGAPPPAPVSLKQSLHVLARVKRPKAPNAKTKVEPVPRGDFNAEVLALLNAAYSPPTPLAPEGFKETTKKNNKFKNQSFAVNGKNVQVYFFVPKTKGDPYEVALIFEYPSTEHGNLFSGIELCLESWAGGDPAPRGVIGAGGEESGAEGGGAGPAPGVF
jgi:hypothetical protein